MSYLMLNIVGFVIAVIIGLTLVWFLRALQAWSERSQQPDPTNPVVQHTLALLAVTRTLLSIRR